MLLLLVGGLVAALVWCFCALALTAGTIFPEASVAVTLLVFFAAYLVPLLIIFTIAAALGRRLSHSLPTRTAIFYGVVVALCVLVLGSLSLMVPDPVTRTTGIRAILDLMLVPTILASLVYPLGFLLLGRRAPQQS
jgi:hypothetical protein